MASVSASVDPPALTEAEKWREHAEKRIKKELKTITDSKDASFSVQPRGETGDDLYKWQITVNGEIKFETKIYHMGVPDNGVFEVPEMKDNWSPALTMVQVIGLIKSMLKSPDTQYPLNLERGQLYKTDPDKYAETAKEWVKLYAQ